MSLSLQAQDSTYFDAAPRGKATMRIVFYNVENLFDPLDDPVKKDDAFTPTGMYGWSYQKYHRKLHNIYRVLMGTGGWEAPAVVGFCEIENRTVLEALTQKTPLSKFGYEIVHEESPDKRGIDVALLYRPEKFQLIDYAALTVRFPFDTLSRTRDILYVRGKTLAQDTLHLFVNHWPSRYGGHLATDPKRAYVAQFLREKIDSIYQQQPKANILIMGDLNDEPSSESVAQHLGAQITLPSPIIEQNKLYNLMGQMELSWKIGTHKHEEHWGILDQIIVSASLLKGACQIQGGRAYIHHPEWLLMEESSRLGKRPFRTFLGAQYLGGYSDHLPIYVDVLF